MAPAALRLLLGIMLPLVKNGIVVVIIVNFVAAWGEFLLALTLMNDGGKRTLPVFIATHPAVSAACSGRASQPSTSSPSCPR